MFSFIKYDIKKHNTVFKADKPVEPVCGLKQCYGDDAQHRIRGDE